MTNWSKTLVHWLRTSPGPAPVIARRIRRRIREGSARRRAGSVTARMDQIVAEAIAGTRSSGRPPRGGA